jgi:hypothetical protein
MSSFVSKDALCSSRGPRGSFTIIQLFSFQKEPLRTYFLKVFIFRVLFRLSRSESVTAFRMLIIIYILESKLSRFCKLEFVLIVVSVAKLSFLLLWSLQSDRKCTIE